MSPRDWVITLPTHPHGDTPGSVSGQPASSSLNEAAEQIGRTRGIQSALRRLLAAAEQLFVGAKTAPRCRSRRRTREKVQSVSTTPQPCPSRARVVAVPNPVFSGSAA